MCFCFLSFSVVTFDDDTSVFSIVFVTRAVMAARVFDCSVILIVFFLFGIVIITFFYKFFWLAVGASAVFQHGYIFFIAAAKFDVENI